ncbi:FadR/GntR family transcriptional regulator [Brevibacterium litoralis]|uniref:FadR/GntR family transcriptional regulator n=1 Tax=Brevibacterium litoralis TaxID=3138935 RepID=UPI0032EC1C47
MENSALEGFQDVVRQSSTPQQIADHVLASIASGALPEGAALPPERELAAGLQVSRSSVRAALDRLERGGFVVRRRGRGGGTFVARPDSAALDGVSDRVHEFTRARRHLLDARAVLQNRVAHHAALHRTDAEVSLLEGLAAAYAGTKDAAAARVADARLHHAMAVAGHNPEIERMAVDLDTRINAGFRHDPFSAALFTRACEDHRHIVAAIRNRDADSAARLCEEHFRATTILEE